MLKTLIRLAARNTTRKRARTLLTAGMIVFGVALLVVGMAWIRGIFGQMLTSATGMSGHVRLVTSGYAEREQLNPLYENISDAQKIIDAAKRVPGVRAVEPRIATGVTVTVGEEIGDVFAMVVGSTESYFRERLGVAGDMARGRMFDPAAEELVMGHRVAAQLGAALGDEVVLLGMTQYGSMSPIKGELVGIVGGTNSAVSQQILVPLERAQWLTDIPGGATEILVYTDAYQRASALASKLREAQALSELEVQPWREREPWASMMGTFDGIQAMLVLIIVFLTALGIWNTMMMSVLERTHEIGVLRAMGLTGLGVVFLFVGEAMAIAVLGGGLGVALGAIPAWILETQGVRLGEEVVANVGSQMPIAETMYADFSVEVAAFCFGLGLVMALVGSLVPSLRAAAIEPVSAMRSGR